MMLLIPYRRIKITETIHYPNLLFPVPLFLILKHSRSSIFCVTNFLNDLIFHLLIESGLRRPSGRHMRLISKSSSRHAKTAPRVRGALWGRKFDTRLTIEVKISIEIVINEIMCTSVRAVLIVV